MRAFIVDAFTQAMFRGNPAGVVLLDRPADAAWMQAVAAEFNHPATAFVDLSGEQHRVSGLRWFSPSTELSLCGHATLASAHILGGDHAFQTKGGVLRRTVGPSGAISMWYLLSFRPEPATDTVVAVATATAAIRSVAGRHAACDPLPSGTWRR